MSMQSRAIRELEIPKCLEFWKKEWQNDPLGYFERYFYGDHDFVYEYSRIIERDGNIAATAHIVKRIVSCGSAQLTIGGIANVLTGTEYRGQGLGLAATQDAVTIIGADAMDVAILFAAIPEFYIRAGFQPIDVCFQSATRNETASKFSCHVRTMVPGDIPAIQRIYNEYNATRPFVVHRSEAYWRDWVGLTDDPPFSVKVAENNEGVVGYIFYRSSVGQSTDVELFEIGASYGQDFVIASFVASFEPGTKLTFAIPGEIQTVAAISRYYSELTENSFPGMFVQFLNLDSLLFGLLLDFNENWVTAGSPPGKLSIQDGDSVILLEPVNGFLNVSRVEQSIDDKLTHAELFRLLMGWGNGRAETKFVSALFPDQAGWFWKLDGF